MRFWAAAAAAAAAFFIVTSPAFGASCPPHLRCGCWLASYFHFTGQHWRSRWVARSWVTEGAPAPKGCTNCVAVFRRGHGGHVGVVKGWDDRGNPIILSDLGSGTVVTIPHPARLLIALRWVD